MANQALPLNPAHHTGPARRLLRLMAPFTGWTILSILLGVATIGSSIGLMTLSAYLIARAALHPSIADLSLAIVGVRFFGIARGLFRYGERYLAHHLTFRLLARLRTWFYAALEPLAPARMLHYRSGDLLARIVADVETLDNFYLRAIAPPAVALLVAALAAGLVGRFDPRLAIALLTFFLAAGIGVPLLARQLSRSTGQRMVRLRAALSATLVDGIQGMAELLAFGQEQRHLDRAQALRREMTDLQARMARIAGLHQALTSLLTSLATVTLVALAIPLVRDGQMDGVYLAALALAVLSSFEAVLPLPAAFQYLDNSLEAARRLGEILAASPAVTDPPAPWPTPDSYDLQVKDLSFAYEPGERPALDGVSFYLPHGGQLAIVGSSGAGKTTLANLLLRFWDCQAGQVRLGGRDLRDYNQQQVRRLIAVVAQHTHLFNATIRDNLLLARPEADQADLVQATRQAQIHDWIASLPEGYDTWIGEQGLRLSAGQRQRLAIARALLQDAPILILDEPTANLDALAEREILTTLQGLMAGRTSLLITHRLLGLETAGEILVLHAGRVVEQGRHHELMQMAGHYNRMWELQNQIV
ncbi:MAG: thiol reductant ABC exporter subunit CydC [Anaerolineae bacterium]|nr:thiol reductant ABC exporter subunit CydC [Anaerolineae bacterium]